MARISTSGICLALLVLLALACHTDDPLSPAPEPNLASPLGPDSSSTSVPDVPQVSIADPPSLLVPTAGPDPTSTPSSRDTWEDHVIITGLEAPTDMEFSSDQRLFVAEQNGKIRIIQNGKLLPSPLLTLPVDSRDGRGLMGLTLDPDFEINRHFYVYYTRAIAPPQNRVSRFTVRADDPNLADPGSELVILDGIPAAIRHNGGVMQFGPDGKPYIGAGDALSGSTAQSLATLAGKVLRVNPDGSIPADNPFVGVPNARREIWAYGLRAPFRGDIDPETGNFYVNDVGVQKFEEINQVIKGANYGWPLCEGKCENSSFVDPVYVYPHPSGCATTGGVFYRGVQFPEEHQGSYFFGDLCAPWIKTLSADYEVADFAVNTAGGIVDLEVGPDGSLYYLSFVNGAVYRIQFGDGGNQPPIAVAQVSPTAGVAPLEVSFDARQSVDPDGDSLTFHWDFGDGSPITAGATAGHVYRTDGPHVVQMIVEDSNGGTEITTVTVLVGNLPSSNVTSPARDATFNAGDIVNYSGIGTDAKDGILPARAFSWSIFLHHGNRTDPGHYAQLFLGPINSVKTGSFLVPLNLNGSEAWFSLHLTVTDSDGLTHESQQDFFPNLTVLTFQSSPPGLTVNLDGQLRATPIHEKSITGSIRTIGAPYSQVADKKKYKFESWSDGGSATHIVITPGSAATYRATYAVEPNFDPSLVGYWAFDERSDARAFDSSGSGNHATLLNQPNWTPGKVAGALSFDGTDDFVKVEDSADRSLDMGARDFTIAAWVKTPSSFWNSDQFRVIVAKASSISYGDTKTNGWGLLIGSNNRLSLVLPGLNPGDFVSDAGTLSTDTWYHVAATYSAALDEATYYVNGKQLGVKKATSDAGNVDNNIDFRIGAQFDDGGLPIQGTLDDIRIYKRALTAEEVQALAAMP